MLDTIDEWQSSPQTCELTPDSVHVWLADLEHVASSCEPLASILDRHERERAANFHLEHDRQQYVSTHVVLRLLLGRYLGLAPERVAFSSGQYGKPGLDIPSDSGSFTPSLRFNLSHAYGIAVYVVALGREVGVDVERISGLPDWERIASTVFSPREQEALRSLPAHERQRAFYVCWARKEALVKATGYGLHMPLDQFDVSLGPGEPARLLDVRGGSTALMDVTHWDLRDVLPIPSYAAALAIEGHNCQVAYRHWSQLTL